MRADIYFTAPAGITVCCKLLVAMVQDIILFMSFVELCILRQQRHHLLSSLLTYDFQGNINIDGFEGFHSLCNNALQ